MSTKTGLELIQEERNEQIHKHNHQVQHDVLKNQDEELKKVAIAMLTNDHSEFPENWNFFKKEKLLNKSYIKRLVVAGALIAAEIDRLIALEKLK